MKKNNDEKIEIIKPKHSLYGDWNPETELYFQCTNKYCEKKPIIFGLSNFRNLHKTECYKKCVKIAESLNQDINDGQMGMGFWNKERLIKWFYQEFPFINYIEFKKENN